MANLGLPGPSNALEPFRPVQEVVSNRISRKFGPEEVLSKLRVTAERQHRQIESDMEFDRILWAANQSKDQMLAEETFVAAAAQLWGFTRVAARAMFYASDVNDTARLDKVEYLLLREAFVKNDEALADNELIQEIQLRAIYFKYVLRRPAQRTVFNTVLTAAEMLDLVRDLCTGDTHVQKVAAHLLPRLRSDKETIPLQEFVGTFMDRGKLQNLLDSNSMSVNDIVSNVRDARDQRFKTGRVVLDGRAESAYLSSPLQEKKGIESDVVGSEAVNADMELDPQCRAVGGWRGPMAVARTSEEYGVALQVIKVAMGLAQEAASSNDMLDRDWLPNGAGLDRLLGKGESLQANKICLLAKACQRQFSSYPSLVRVRAPAKVFGDIHGQLRDVLLLFGLFGMPYHCGGDIQTTSYVFNGDFVDRGEHQLEVVALLFSLHVVYPMQVYLVRGNHEFRDMSENMGELGFLHHCQSRMKKRWRSVFDAVHSAFDWMPLGAVVAGKVLVLHGGLGDGTWGLRDLEELKRPMQELDCDHALNALWSDPSDSDNTMSRGVHSNEERGEGAGIHQFGPDITQTFCMREGIDLVIRSHQFVRQGYKVMHGGHLITLFSARNYLLDDGEASHNDAAMILLATDLNGHLRVHPKRVAFMPHPDSVLPKESWWKNFSEEFAACWHFLATGQKLRRKGQQNKPNVKFNRKLSGSSSTPTSPASLR